MKFFCTIFFTVFLFFITAAQQPADSIHIKSLEEVVITGTRTASKLGNVAVPTQLIPQRIIRQTGSLVLQDILQEQTGIIIVNSNLGTALNGYPNPFGQGVQMLGLDPAYTLILLDGEPLIGRNAGILKLDRLATGNIKQIEIVKGPSSSLYGSEAMAGVINIITESPQKESLGLQLHAASHNTWGGTLSYDNRFQKTGIRFFLNRYSSSGYDLDHSVYGKTVDPFRNWNSQLRIDHDFSDKVQLLVSLRDYDSKQMNNYQVYAQNLPAIVKGNTNEKDQTAFAQLRWQLNRKDKIFFRAFYDHYQDNSFVNLEKTNTLYDQSVFNQSILKPELQFEASKPGRSSFIGGIGSYIEMINATRYAGKQTVHTYYAFAQQEWDLLQQRLTVIAGGRLDKRDDFSARLSPRLSLAWKPNSHWKFTASSGGGFKAPDFRHLYLDFFNSEVGYSLLGAKELGAELQQMQQQGLLQPGADIMPFLNLPGLKPETSFGSHVGARYTGGKLTAEGGLFRNDIHNLIDVYTLPFTRSNNGSIFSYHNIGRVYTQGFETDISYTISRSLIISAGYQFLDAKDKDVLRAIDEGALYKRDLNTLQTSLVKRSDYFGLFNRSRHIGNFKINWNNSNKGWNAYLRFIYRGRFGFQDLNGDNIPDDPQEMVKGFLLVNAVVGKKINDHFNVQLGVENIGNYTQAQQMPNIAGRLFFINVNYAMDKLFQNNKSK